MGLTRFTFINLVPIALAIALQFFYACTQKNNTSTAKQKGGGSSRPTDFPEGEIDGALGGTIASEYGSITIPAGAFSGVTKVKLNFDETPTDSVIVLGKPMRVTFENLELKLKRAYEIVLIGAGECTTGELALSIINKRNDNRMTVPLSDLSVEMITGKRNVGWRTVLTDAVFFVTCRTDNLNAGTSGKSFSLADRFSSNGSRACYILDSGDLKCWGANHYGELGLGDKEGRGDHQPSGMGSALPRVDLGTGRTAVQVTVGSSHICVLLDNGQVKCWGHNNDCVLGTGIQDMQTVIGGSPNDMGDNLPAIDIGESVIAIASDASDAKVCALTESHRLKCWGDLHFQEVGVVDVGCDLNQMGDRLPYIDLGTGALVKSIKMGVGYSCALLDDNRIKCWGLNQFGELGLGTNSTFYGGEESEMGENLPAVDLGTSATVQQLSLGYRHTCAVLEDHEVRCWGLSWTSSAITGDAPSEMGANLSPLTFPESGTPSWIANHDNFCFIQDGSVYCWGDGNEGALGQGNTEDADMTIPVRVPLQASQYRVLTNRIGQTCALDGVGVICWGANYGGLGLGDMDSRGNDPGEVEALGYIPLE